MCKRDLLSAYCHGFIFIILSHMTNWIKLKSLAISKYHIVPAAHVREGVSLFTILTFTFSL